ncbi:hypothetical protein BJY04DRAFT_216481 [Aspergillus karnatakaensis]|uniref:uncharacterized protein n=1 Tax=Aspergillus karnatakaensis TaxID=1810916 RepID=UPI003CCD694E
MALRNFLTNIPNLPPIPPLWDSNPERTAEWLAEQDRQIRHEIREEIINLFDRIYHSPCPYIAPSAPGQLKITCKYLSLNDAGGYDEHKQFFKPKPLSWLRSHPVDTKKIPKNQQAGQQWSAPKTGQCADYVEAASISAGFICEFSRYARIGIESDYTLEELSGWIDRGTGHRIESRPSMKPSTPDNDARPAAPWNTRIAASWIRDDAHPHLTCILENASPPHDDLLRSEVLTILGLMRESLSRYSLQKHRIVPITAISCMNGREARLLQAFFLQEELVIYKSGLLNFSIEKSMSVNVPLFMLYLASEPVGDTILKPYQQHWLWTGGDALATLIVNNI